MHDQPKYEPLEASTFFADGSSARPMVEGTVARGMLREEMAYYTGRTADDRFVTELPTPLTPELLERGRSRYNAFCSPCHGQRGDGQGMIVRRGFKQPSSFHEPRLRNTAAGYFFNVMTNGFGQMSSYAAQLSHQDRWAITAYIYALQLSRNIPASELDESERRRLSDSGELAEAAADASAEHP
jgi:mono/diheme cytochrome c family protein